MASHLLHRRASARTRMLALALAGALAASMLAVTSLPAVGGEGFVELDRLTLEEDEGPMGQAILDADGTHAFFATVDGPTPVVVVKVRLADMTRIGALELPVAGSSSVRAAISDGTHGYFFTNNGSIVKVDLDAMTVVGTPLELSQTRGSASAHPFIVAGAAAGSVGYFVGRSNNNLNSEATPGQELIVKVDLQAMTQVQLLELGEPNRPNGRAMAVVVDPGADPDFAYVIQAEGRVDKVDLKAGSGPNAMALVETLLLPATDMQNSDGDVDIVDAALMDADGTHVYFATMLGRLLKVDVTADPMVQVGSAIQVAEGSQRRLRTAVLDPAEDVGYFVADGGTTRVFTVDLAAMEKVAELSISNDESMFQNVRGAGVWVGSHLYLASSNTPARVVRIGLDSDAADSSDDSDGEEAAAEQVAVAVAAAAAANVAGSSSAVLVRGGELVEVTSSLAAGVGPRGGVVLEAEGLKVTLFADGGAGADTGVVVPSSGEIECEVCAAFAAGSVIEAWMYSSPQLVAAVQVSADHDDDCILLRIPVGDPLTGAPIAAGEHTLQLRMPAQDGIQVLATGVTVGSAVPTSVPAGDGPAGGGLLGMFGLLAAAAAMLAARRLVVTG